MFFFSNSKVHNTMPVPPPATLESRFHDKTKNGGRSNVLSVQTNAFSMTLFSVVSSLQSSCLRAITTQLPVHEHSLEVLPQELKAKLIHLLSKRGLLTDNNLLKVLYL